MPRIHNLVRLAELAGLSLDADVVDFLSGINGFNVQGRYVEYLGAAPELKQAKGILRRAEGLLTWLNETL